MYFSFQSRIGEHVGQSLGFVNHVPEPSRLPPSRVAWPCGLADLVVLAALSFILVVPCAFGRGLVAPDGHVRIRQSLALACHRVS